MKKLLSIIFAISLIAFNQNIFSAAANEGLLKDIEDRDIEIMVWNRNDLENLNKLEGTILPSYEGLPMQRNRLFETGETYKFNLFRKDRYGKYPLSGISIALRGPKPTGKVETVSKPSSKKHK